MASFQDFDYAAAFGAPQDEPKAPGLLRHAADTALQLGQGVLSGADMLASTFGADNAAARTFRDGAKWLAGNFSDQLKWEQLTAAQDQHAAALSGSTWEEVKAAARAVKADPVGFLVNAAGTTLPTVAAAFIPGGQGALLGRLAAVAIGGAQGAGAVKGQIYEAVHDAWKRDGASDEEAQARASAAQEYLGSNGGQIALGTALGVMAGGTGAEASILGARAGANKLASEAVAAPAAGLFTKAAQRVPRFVREGVKEAGPEAMQGGQEQLAANLALQNEGFDAPTWAGVAGQATMEGMAGGLMGAAISPLHRPSDRPAAPAPEPARGDRALVDLAQARTAEAAIDAAARVADVPLSGSLSQEQEARALTALDEQSSADMQAIRRSGFAMPLDQQRASLPPMPEPQASAEPQALAADVPFGDRVLTLREQLADASVREGLRALGPDALALVSQYASIADRPDVSLPEKTRERMLSLAEAMVSRAVARPLETARAGPSAMRVANGPALDGPPSVPRIGLDTAPTGVLRADAAGNIAPETRADAIDTRQRSMRAPVDGMSQQVPRGQAPQPAPKPVPEAKRAPRTRLAQALDVDPQAPNAVAQFVQRMRGINTPAARAFVQDFEAGRIEPADVLARLVPQPQESADDRLQAAARQAPAAPKPGDLVDERGKTLAALEQPAQPSERASLLVTSDGFPYGTRAGAQARATREGGQVVEVEGGFAVQTEPAPAEAPTLKQRVDAMRKPVHLRNSADASPAATPTAVVFPTEKIEELVGLTGRDRAQVAKEFGDVVRQHGRERADQFLQQALATARRNPKPTQSEPNAQPAEQAAPAQEPGEQDAQQVRAELEAQEQAKQERDKQRAAGDLRKRVAVLKKLRECVAS